MSKMPLFSSTLFNQFVTRPICKTKKNEIIPSDPVPCHIKPFHTKYLSFIMLYPGKQILVGVNILIKFLIINLINLVAACFKIILSLVKQMSCFVMGIE